METRSCGSNMLHEQCVSRPLSTVRHMCGRITQTPLGRCNGNEERELRWSSVTGRKSRERLAAPAAEIRNVQTSRSRPPRLRPDEPL
jgi:hypothetical protein